MSNYFLNSESVFEVIGNYPIVDQFDVLYSNLQTGSYVDNYVTGSLLKIAISPLNKIAFTTGERGLAFSKLGVPATQFPTQDNNTVNRSYNLQSWRSRAGVIRNVKIFSDSERFYDSLLPDLSNVVKIVGGTIVGYTYPYAYGNYLDTAPIQSIYFSFPFEPLYSSVQRQTILSKGFISTTDTPTQPAIISERLLIGIGDTYFANAGDYRSGGAYMVSSCPVITSTVPVNSGAFASDVAKFIFGFGDADTYFFNYQYGFYGKGYKYMAMFRSGTNGRTIDDLGAVPRVVGPFIRGWKYGIHDGNPHYTSCVFRRDRFGQFRDMLEQRVEPVSYFDPENSPLRLFDAAEGSPIPNTQISSQKTRIEYPVEVNFVQISLDKQNKLYYSKIDPNLTRSSNLSAHATSSLPFFDATRTEIGKNRPIIPDSLLTSVEILSAEI